MNVALIVLGLIFGATAGYLVWDNQRQVEEEMRALEYFVLSPEHEGLAPGEVIDPRALTTVPVPSNFSALDSFAIRADEENSQWIAGRVVSTPVKPGTLLTFGMFAADGDARFDHLITEGMRAFTLRVDVENSVNNQIGPGNRIDVVGVVRVDSEQGTTSAGEVLLEDVKVLAVGRATTWDAYQRLADRGYRTITLEVTPDEARKFALDLSRIQGGLTMLLRNPCDSRKPSADCG